MPYNQSVFVCNLYNKYLSYLGLIVVFLFTCSAMYTKFACIIIHGTWAQNETWYRPGGDFFEAVKSCNNEIKIVDEIVSFSWSGKLGHPAQVEAAKKLVTLIEAYDFVILIAHSHGATVGMIASQILFGKNTNGNNCGKVVQFYSLGAPIKESITMPSMYVIKKFYNVFSFGDFIQTVNGAYDRTFVQSGNMVNISIQYNDVHPSHAQLHHPAIGMWLLKIENFLMQNRIGNFEKFRFVEPGVIFFRDHQHPVYRTQEDQYGLLELDKKIHEWSKTVFFRGFKHENIDDSQL